MMYSAAPAQRLARQAKPNSPLLGGNMAATTTEPLARAVTIELPPAMPVSALKQKSLPNWALKTAMAVTGTFGALFLGLHLFGNLKVYTGAEHFNTYAYSLRHFGEPYLPAESFIWVLRLALVACLAVHVCAAAILWSRSRQARGKFAAKRNAGVRSWGATLMPVTGVLIACFVVFHLLDLTLGVKPVAAGDFQHPDGDKYFAYQNLVASFQRPAAALIYIAMMLLIAIHVWHGISTVVTDLGTVGKRLRAVFAVVGGAFAVIILLGNASIPVSVLAGWVS
jgi:succinate dehydrogenase / fumarate reductase cytochrome b subunit